MSDDLHTQPEIHIDDLDASYFLRQAWRSREDQLKLRISAGNRLVAIFRDRFIDDESLVTVKKKKSKKDKTETDLELDDVGDPSVAKDPKVEKNDKMLATILQSYKNITEYIAGKLEHDEKLSDISADAKIEAKTGKTKVSKKKITKLVKVTQKNFKIPDTEKYIRQYPEYLILDSYMGLARAEEIQCENLEKLLQGIPIYDQYLSQIKGVGAIISAFLISEINIHKCIYPSQLHSYFGLAPKNGMANIKANWNKTSEDGGRIGVLSFSIRNASGKSIFIGKMKEWGDLKLASDKIDEDIFKKNITLVEDYENPNNFRVIFNEFDVNISFDKKLFETKEQVQANALKKVEEELAKSNVLPKGKKKTEAQIIADGKDFRDAKKFILKESTGDFIGAERTLGYKIELQGKLKGAAVMPLVCHNTKYREIRNGYKARYKSMPIHKDKSDGHIQSMANTMMLKVFLTDLYVAWRTLENLTVAVPYEEAKLGIQHNTGINVVTRED